MSSSNESNGKDTSSKQVIEYYKKFSQNRDLPKYFSGSSVAYLPKIVDTETKSNTVSPDSNKHDNKFLINTNIDVHITSPTESEKSETQNINQSRSSSSMSNRKLEWDSGADIGYNNCLKSNTKPTLLFKSSSLSALSDLKNKKVDSGIKRLLAEYTKGESSSSDGNVQVIIVSYSSSSSDEVDDLKDNKNPVDLSSSSPATMAETSNTYKSMTSSDAPVKSINSNSDSTSSKIQVNDNIDKKISNFAVTLFQLKQKIGSPNAQSTPNYFESFKPQNVDTPLIKKSDKVPRKILQTSIKRPVSKSDSESLYMINSRKKKEESVCVSRSEESIFKRSSSIKSEIKSRSKKTISHIRPKVVNLCLTKPITVECNSSPVFPKNQVVQALLFNVGVQTEYISQSALVKNVKSTHTTENRNQSVQFFEHSDENRTNSSSQTNSNIIASCCDSFEYQKISKNNKEGVITHDDIIVHSQSKTSGLKRSQRESDLRDSETDFKSAQSLNPDNSMQPESATANIEKATHLINKLIHSKKYDPASKKKYIKSIVKKMSESKYFDDSSASSDLFFPRKSKVDMHISSKVTSSDSSGPKVTQENCLQSNKPWFPAHNPVLKPHSPRKRKFEIRTFTDVIPPTMSKEYDTSPPEIIPVNKTKTKDSKNAYFTLTNNEFSVNQMTDSTNSDGVKFDSSVSLKKHFKSSSTSGGTSNYENWREDKTSSEKLLESKYSSNKKDQIVTFAEQERQNQLTWINNEIVHLSKLRSLLKEQGKTNIQAPQVSKKNRTVYQVIGSDKSDKQKSGIQEPGRNYIIETDLGVSNSSNVEFNLNGKQYAVNTVKGTTTKSSSKRRVAGNIMVTTNDNITNIKVSTFCQMCKQVPCVCICPKCQKSPCECEKMRSCCSNCKKLGCICSINSVPTSSNPQCHRGSSDFENVQVCCSNCNKFGCTCTDDSASATENSSNKCRIMKSSCYMCQQIPCICEIPKDACQQCYTFPKVADKNKSDCLPHTYPKRMCAKCQKASCICDLSSQNFMSVSNTAQTITTSKDAEQQFVNNVKRAVFGSTTQTITTNTKNVKQQYDNNSLKRVFENCECTTQTSCKCHFVDKLVNHFKIQTERGTDLNKPSKCRCQNIGVQVQVETNHGFSQTTNTVTTLSAVHQEPETVSAGVIHTDAQTISTNSVSNQGINSRLTFGAQTKTKVTQCEGINAAVSVGVIAHSETKDQRVQSTNVCDPKQTIEKSVGESTLHYVEHKSVNTRFDNDTTFTQTYTGVKHLEAQTRSENIAGHTQTASATVPVDKRTGKSSSSNESSTSPSIKHKVKFGKSVEIQVGDGKFRYASNVGIASNVEFGGVGDRICNNECGRHLREQTCPYHCSTHGDQRCMCCPEYKTPCCSPNPHCSTAKGAVCNCDPTDTSNGISTSVLDTEDMSDLTCACCKKPETRGNVQLLLYGSDKYPLCFYCYQTKPVVVNYCSPEHVCHCYSYNNNYCSIVPTEQCVPYNTEYCTCTYPYQHPQNYNYCGYCQNKLRKTVKGKGGIAYSLKLENVTPNKIKKKKEKNLQEILIKVPGSKSSKKKDKDKENYHKKDNSCPECIKIKKGSTKCPVCIKIQKQKDQSESKSDKKDGKVEVELNIEVTSDDESSKIKHTTKRTYSLQDYLQQNRPDFMDSAENRRKAVLISRLQREEDKDEVRLRFLEENAKQLEDNIHKNPRLFSEREMRDITKKNYKKLPEVREKLIKQKVQQLRSADKLIKDEFTKKIQNSVLKGKRSFPIDKNIVRLPSV